MISKRSNIQIIGEILGLGESGKTRIMYTVNMSHGQMEKYLDYLQAEGFIEISNGNGNGNGRVRYRPTAQGNQLLAAIRTISEVLDLDMPAPAAEAHSAIRMPRLVTS